MVASGRFLTVSFGDNGRGRTDMGLSFSLRLNRDIDAGDALSSSLSNSGGAEATYLGTLLGNGLIENYIAQSFEQRHNFAR